ncbi:MAG: DUF11 domain-containing protein [Candidatus Thiodiazotropha sp. (ex Lucinoma borealis)]|nr:DUF11 domain-containing protein [Candidatus Thiodiazotropha sp. (ex Lucinoma borealis)]
MSNDDQYNVVTFQRDTTNGTLTYLSNATSTVLHGSNPDYETLYWPTTVILSPDPEQKFLYTGSQISDAINVFRRNAQDGSLSWIGWVTDGVGEVALNSVQQIAIFPDGHFIYSASDDGGDIAIFDTRADLSVVKSENIDPIQPSETLTYTLAVTNNGPADTQNLVITDTLPAGVTYVSGSLNMPGGTCNESDNTVSCTLGSLVAAGGVTATLEVRAPATEEIISNTASVSADQLDTVTDNDSDSEETMVSISGGSGATSPPTTGDTPGSDGDGGGGSSNPLTLLLLSALWPLFRNRLSFE